MAKSERMIGQDADHVVDDNVVVVVVERFQLKNIAEHVLLCICVSLTLCESAV